MVCYRINVFGRVQGVFYRASTVNRALELGVSGWVRNEPDGSVLIEAEGSKDKIIDLIDWCKEGPPHAHVERVIQEEAEVRNYRDFKIKY